MATPRLEGQGFNIIEYEQTSEDWRHRDSLTWQLPAVLIGVGGALVAQALELPAGWVRNAIFFFAAALAVCLTVALWQNLRLQRKDREIIKDIYKNTRRFGFYKVGSILFLLLSVAASAFFVVLVFLSISKQI